MANTVKVITSNVGTKVYRLNMLAVAGAFAVETLKVPQGYRLIMVNHTPVVAASAVTDLSVDDTVTGLALITDVTDLSQAVTNYPGLATDGTYTTLGDVTVTLANNVVAAANVILTLVFSNDI